MGYENCYDHVDEFYGRIKTMIKAAPADRYVLISMDLDNFNFINDLFGYEIGDRFLETLSSRFSAALAGDELFSKIHADNFIFLMRNDLGDVSERMASMLEIRADIAEFLPKHYTFVCSAGIVRVPEARAKLATLLDQAHFARKHAKGSHHHTFLHFNDKMLEELQWKKIITLSMDMALSSGEFEMYLQPKVLFRTKEVVGAEALVRWNSHQHGMIFPDQFIPIMEQNGFITQLDFYILEKACLFIRALIQSKEIWMPISVNFSKVHLRDATFVQRIYQTVTRFDVPAQLIEIELTENVFMEDSQRLYEVIVELKHLGFSVSLDDFGNAYSSLNYLKEMPLDIIKIDKDFLRESTGPGKGRMIISKIVELIKSLRMVSVMEGVELSEQVDFLSKMGCDLGQGYFFAKPMPVIAYLAFIAEHEVSDELRIPPCELIQLKNDAYIQGIPQEFQMDNWELYTLGQNIDMGIMKGYLDGNATVQYVNDKALEYIGYTRLEFQHVLHNNIVAFTLPEDVDMVYRNTQQLAQTGEPFKFESRAVRKDGKIITLRGRASCVMDRAGHPVGIYTFQDVTDQIRETERLQADVADKIAQLERLLISERTSKEEARMAQERYKMVVDQSDDVVFDWSLEEGSIEFWGKYQELLGEHSIQSNARFYEVLRRLIYPEDFSLVENWIVQVRTNSDVITLDFRIRDAENGFIWMRGHSKTMFEGDRAVRVIGALGNNHTQKIRLQQLEVRAQIDALTQLLNKDETEQRISSLLHLTPTQSGAFFMMDIDDFKFINDNLGHNFGDTILQEVAGILKQVFDANSIVGRIGGDEFAAFVCGISTQEQAQSLAQCFLHCLNGLRYGRDAEYRMNGSIGISIYPVQGNTFEQLYIQADSALYESKRQGKNRFTFYSDTLGCDFQNNKTPLEYDARLLSAYFKDDTVYNIFEMLYETKDMPVTVNAILSILGKYMEVERVYIFEHTADGAMTHDTYEWCAPGILSFQENLQALPVENLSSFFGNFDSEGIFCCQDIRQLDPYSRELLEQQGVTAFIHCAMMNEGKMAGFVGFDLCGRTREWKQSEIALLVYIARVFSIFLVKLRMKRELVESYENSVAMLENLNGYIYVVDTQTMRLLYLNRATANLGVRTGALCHMAAFGSDKPCKNCPVFQLSDTVNNATAEIYSVKLDAWVSSAASKLNWTGCKSAALICCTDITRYKQ